MTEKFSEFGVARDAFFATDPDLSCMDHADLVAWHNFAREVETAELNEMQLTMKYGPRNELMFA